MEEKDDKVHDLEIRYWRLEPSRSTPSESHNKVATIDTWISRHDRENHHMDAYK